MGLKPSSPIETSAIFSFLPSMEEKKNPSWIIISTYLLLLLAHSANSESDDVKRSLIAFLHKLAPRNSTIAQDLGWSVSSDPCAGEWSSVVCNGRTKSVRSVVLEGLPLGGPIDASLLCSASSIWVLSLRDSRVTGRLPPEISNCSQLTHLYLGDNRLSGSLPSSLVLLKNLKRLDLSNNSFSGELPPDLAAISGLITFRAENNRFNGSVPEFDFGNLRKFNVSNNLLSGPVPQNAGRFVGRDAFLNNAGLCGGPLEVACPPSRPAEPVEEKSKINGERVIEYSGYLILGLVLVLYVAYEFVKRKEKKSVSTSMTGTSRPEYSISVSNYEQSPAAAASKSLVVLENPVVDELKFESLLKAPAEMLGKGKLGTCYKVTMRDGAVLAVKRIKDWSVSAEDFQGRMERLERSKHCRVLPAIAYYCSEQEKLVVYEYKPNGSLFKLLHGRQEGNAFDWSNRLAVAAGIAEGMAFMHDDLREVCFGHGNLKSTNILLDEDMEPCISEYGLLALPEPNIATPNSSTIPVNGSVIQADTYGFGIILLELLTGKPVLNNGAGLITWVNSMVREEWTAEIFDKALVAVSEERLVRLLQVALMCVDPSVDSRPAMSQVAKTVRALKEEEDEDASIDSTPYSPR